VSQCITDVGRGHSSLSRPLPQWGEGHPPHTPPPRRLRRLDLNPSHYEILPTLLNIALHRGRLVRNVFTQWSKNRFSAPQGRHVAPINVKFGTEEWTVAPSAPPRQISRLWGQKCGNTALKLSKFRILAINVPLSGHSFAHFFTNF